jgi:glutamate-1-semialdehyde 2,1-aminomutase
VSGSYGLNVAGFERYKEWIQDGWERVKDLGPVLGPLHPVVAENVSLLKSVSGLDEVSFHMSGTEAVMAAVRLARFNTRKKLIVCFSGAYHGWWDGVQPGLGSERTIPDCLVLKDMHPASLEVLRRRAGEIAAVLVNPVQSFHPNSPPPSDAVLLSSGMRRTQAPGTAYPTWLRSLRAVCSEVGIPLILDEVYTGFRLAPGGAQEYFDVSADLVVYGKTVAGGMPIGVVCGRRGLMRRFDPERPLRMEYVVGTFSGHPLVMGAMNAFLRWALDPATARLYAEMNARCTEWVTSVNQTLIKRRLPIRVVNLATVWTVLFNAPGRYNWLLQYYLRAEGVTLSWVGTGRCLASMDFTPGDYHDLEQKLLAAATRMKNDGWWLDGEEAVAAARIPSVRMARELVGALAYVPPALGRFYAEIMQRKKDDHHASHSNVVNQFFHLLSSSVFLYCYAAIFGNLTRAMCLGLAALFVRQIGHALLEPPCHEKEKLLLGFNTPSKTAVVGTYCLIPLVHLFRSGTWTWSSLLSVIDAVALDWFLFTMVVVWGRVAYLTWKHDLRAALIWFVKLATDPFTDIVTYSPLHLMETAGVRRTAAQ